MYKKLTKQVRFATPGGGICMEYILLNLWTYKWIFISL